MTIDAKQIPVIFCRKSKLTFSSSSEIDAKRYEKIENSEHYFFNYKIKQFFLLRQILFTMKPF